MDPAASDPSGVVALLAGRGQTVAVAESLTGGLLCGALTGVPGASAVVRGAVVAYATDLKAGLLGVDPLALAHDGAVHERTAAAMAEGVRDRLGATWGLATTGVAGPDPQEGRPPGLVHVAVAGALVAAGRTLRVDGDRDAVRRAAVSGALALLAEALAGELRGLPPGATSALDGESRPIAEG